MKTLTEIFPPTRELLKLEPEDIAPLILLYLNQGAGRQLSRYNLVLRSGDIGQYAGDVYDEVARAVTEGWMVLEREGLLAPEVSASQGDWRFITRRGKSLQSHTDFAAYRRGS